MGLSTAYGYSNLGKVGYGTATGGASSSITVSGQAYTLLTFTSDTNLVISTAGLFDYYIIAGGGGGGSYSYGGGGGGGAAGWFTGTSYIAAGTYSCNIGAGGGTNTDGSPSFLAGVGLAPAGVRGVAGAVYVYSYGLTGPSGSGGGGTAGVNTNSVNTATRGVAYYNGYFGFRGGGGWNGDNNSGGGGGGAGGVGGDSQSSTVAGAGGAGKDISAFLGQSAETTLKMVVAEEETTELAELLELVVLVLEELVLLPIQVAVVAVE
jgi:hypothetical protein